MVEPVSDFEAYLACLLQSLVQIRRVEASKSLGIKLNRVEQLMVKMQELLMVRETEIMGQIIQEQWTQAISSQLALKQIVQVFQEFLITLKVKSRSDG